LELESDNRNCQESESDDGTSDSAALPSTPHHIEDGENVDSQPGHVMPDNQSGRSCTGSDISLFESVDSDKEGASSDGAFDYACKQENSKFARTNILLLSEVSRVGMLGTDLVYLAQIGSLAIITKVFNRNEGDGARFF